MTSRSSAIVVGAAAAVWLAASWAFVRFTPDDAFITARHAENLVDAGSLVFNVGDRVSALTSPLHGLVEAGLYAITRSTIPAYKALAFLLVAGTIFFLFRREATTPATRAIAASVIAAPCVALWTWAGLETPILLFFATSLTLASRSNGAPSQRRAIAIHLLAALAFLTRYDSVLFCAPIVLQSWLDTRRAKTVLIASISGAAPAVVWLLVARTYYGDIFPTSFYVKSPEIASATLASNVAYVTQCLFLTGLLFFGLAAGAEALRKNGRDRQWYRANVGLMLGLLLQLTYGLGVATHHMMFSFRFFVPYLPAAVILLCRWWSDHAPVLAARRGVLFVVTLALVASQGAQVAYTLNRSINGFVHALDGRWAIEYRKLSVKNYVNGFLPVLAKGAEDVRRDWSTRRPSAVRGPRIMTFAGGVLPYEYREAYVYEVLASYRHNYTSRILNINLQGKTTRWTRGIVPKRHTIDLRSSSDYIHHLTPRHGPAEDVLIGGPEEYEVVSRHEILFGPKTQTFIIYYNPRPGPNLLPKRMSGERIVE